MDQIIQDILTEEKEILNCMQVYFCTVSTFLAPTGTTEDVKAQVDIVKSLLCAMSSKERAVADVLDASSHVLLGVRGVAPCGGNADDDICCGC